MHGHADAFGVVAVLVRDQHGIELGGVEACFVAAGEEVALADAAVDQHAASGGGVFDDGGIAAASAGKDMELKHEDVPDRVAG